LALSGSRGVIPRVRAEHGRRSRDMLDQLPWADMCHGLQAAIGQPTEWTPHHDCEESDVEEEVRGPQQAWKARGLDAEEEREEDGEEQEAEREELGPASQGLAAQEASVSQRFSGYSPFAWGSPRTGVSPFGPFQPESPLVCLVRRMTSGFLSVPDGELERRRLFGDDSDDGKGYERSKVGVQRISGCDEASRQPLDDIPLVALGRYQYRPVDIVGSGGFSTVRKGVDLLTGRPVAIKTFSEMELQRGADMTSGEEADELLRQFEGEVRMLTSLHSAASAFRPSFDSSSFVLAEASLEVGRQIFEGLPPSRELFVEILDFSRRGDGPPRRVGTAGGPAPGARAPSRHPEHQPGPAADGQCYLVLELASETLEEFLAGRKTPLPAREVQRIFREACEVVAALHSLGFVHLDLKPANLMRFPSGRFKLIDMDGMQACGALVPVADIISTPKYCAPEVASATLEDNASEDGISLKISRLLDVFSLGLIGVELAAGAHPLEGVWRHFTDGSVEDEVGFLRFLCSPGAEIPLPLAVRELSAELEGLLRSMLRVRGRASMPEVISSPFFRQDLAAAPGAEQGRCTLAGAAAGQGRRKACCGAWEPRERLRPALPSDGGA